MAAGEKTEAPTPRKLQEARKKGQVPRSREVDNAVVILAAVGVFKFGGGAMWNGLEGLTVSTWSHLGEDALHSDLASMLGVSIIGQTLMVLLPLFLVLASLALLGGMAQTNGPLFSTQAIKPQAKRLNPLQGAKRLVASRQAYMNLAKTLVKFVVLGLVAYLTFRSRWDEISTAGLQAGLRPGVATFADVGFDIALKVGLVMLVLAIADYTFQRADHTRQLRMTRQEVQDEQKQTDGDPLVKGQIARLRRSLLQRIMQSVPKADVVIVNPTHYAVALRYDPATSAAPVVVARGMHLMAQRIREVAEEHGIPVIVNPPLCRAVYKAARVGQEIPADLYEAVAEILAFIFRLRTGGVVRVSA